MKTSLIMTRQGLLINNRLKNYMLTEEGKTNVKYSKRNNNNIVCNWQN